MIRNNSKQFAVLTTQCFFLLPLNQYTTGKGNVPHIINNVTETLEGRLSGSVCKLANTNANQA